MDLHKISSFFSECLVGMGFGFFFLGFEYGWSKIFPQTGALGFLFHLLNGAVVFFLLLVLGSSCVRKCKKGAWKGIGANLVFMLAVLATVWYVWFHG